ncbi:helix-turn-helix domain-containing protein [Microbacterium algeriense]|nr:helix-turn-helix transcriptional regulator [Microbacterium algeriense]
MSESVNYRQNWAAYLRHMMAGRSQAEFAKAIQATDGQLSKWLSGTTGVTAEKVITIARLLKDNPVHALARVGWLSVAELTPFRVPRTYGLDEFEDRELAMEIVRRIDSGEAAHWLTEPVDAANVAPRREDFGLVSNETINEFPGGNDTDFDHA